MAVEALECSNNMVFDETMEAGALETKTSESANQVSIDESSHSAVEDDEEYKLELGPQLTLKEHLEKDKVCILWLSNPAVFFLFFFFGVV